MDFAELKQAFLNKIVVGGYQTVEEIPADITHGIPTHLVSKWMRQLVEAPAITAIPQTPMCLNRFTIGADPEFSFRDIGGNLVNAMKCGLQTGLAFGMDMNGRLVELRPVPSKFVLDVVASISVELKWLGAMVPNSLQYFWMSSPYDGADGVGGHVHFARIRAQKDRMEDISCLSHVNSILLKLGILNKQLNDFRVANTKYGRGNDIRPQKYGYEYRAFPTWLDSPWLTYFVLVMSKLALYNPRMIHAIANLKNQRTQERALINLVGLYKNQDDDAWITFQALKKWGLPKQGGIDFRINWGITFPPLPQSNRMKYFPTMIEPTEVDKQEVFDFLVNGIPITPRLPFKTWEPQEIPNHYIWMMETIETYHKIGMGEIGSGLVFHDKCAITLLAGENNSLQINYNKYPCLEGMKKLAELDSKLRVVTRYVADENMISIYLPQSLRSYDTIPEVKKILTSGLFPIWDVKDVKDGCFEEWVKKNEVVIKDQKLIGKELVI